jgi:transcriptional regulator with XRE-family HTH domain
MVTLSAHSSITIEKVLWQQGGMCAVLVPARAPRPDSDFPAQLQTPDKMQRRQITVTQKQLAELAGVAPSSVARNEKLRAARCGRGRYRLDHPAVWAYLAKHPFELDANGDPAPPPPGQAGFLRPALAFTHAARDDDGEPLINPLHPNAVAFLARLGRMTFEEWIAQTYG